MRDLLDSHVHTLASGHAYSTVREVTEAARQKGLKLIGITEHAPAMEGSCAEIYFRNLRILPRKQDDLWTLYGTELNILDEEGSLDLPERLIKECDVTLISIHPSPTYGGGRSADSVTRAYLRAMATPGVNIIGHPDDGRYPVNYGELVRAAKAYHVLLELNNSSLRPTTHRENTRENCMAMLDYCVKYQAPIIVNSDAHADFQVGEHTEALELLREIGFPEELVVNYDLDRYFSFVNYNPLFE